MQHVIRQTLLIKQEEFATRSPIVTDFNLFTSYTNQNTKR